MWALFYEVASSYYYPCLTKLLVVLFERSELSKLNASLSTAVTSANLFSGSVVTVAIGFVSLGVFLAIDLSLYLVGLVLFFALKVETKPSAETPSEPPASLWNGVKVVKSLLKKKITI